MSADVVANPTLFVGVPDTIAINGIGASMYVFSFPHGALSEVGSSLTLPGTIDNALLTAKETPAAVPEPVGVILLATVIVVLFANSRIRQSLRRAP